MGPYAVVNLALSRLQSRLKPIYHVRLCQSRLYPPVRDLGLGPGSVQRKYLLNEAQWVGVAHTRH
jgi:hypothetical protein